MPGALVDALGLENRSDDPIPELIASLQGKAMLLVLDNCEHVIETAAPLAARILRGAPGVQILATGREPLRAEGEHVHRLPPLQTPRTSVGLTAAEALGFPAVRLFVERAAATLGAFELNDAGAPIVADICRKLDGIPLAIELAAGRVDAFGLRGLAAHLDDPLQLLTGGAPLGPAAAPHDAGSARLGPRSAPRARARGSPAPCDLRPELHPGGGERGRGEHRDRRCGSRGVRRKPGREVADRGGGRGRGPCYRLLETTRAYALEKLADSGELEQVERRYTDYSRGLVQRTEVGWGSTPAAKRLAGCGRRRIDAAQEDWAFSPAGDALIGGALMDGSVPAR